MDLVTSAEGNKIPEERRSTKRPCKYMYIYILFYILFILGREVASPSCNSGDPKQRSST